MTWEEFVEWALNYLHNNGVSAYYDKENGVGLIAFGKFSCYETGSMVIYKIDEIFTIKSYEKMKQFIKWLYEYEEFNNVAED